MRKSAQFFACLPASTTLTMTAGDMARLQIRIVSALNQGPAQTDVIVRIGATTVFTGVSGGFPELFVRYCRAFWGFSTAVRNGGDSGSK